MRLAGGGHQLQDVGHADQGVAAGDDARVDDAAVAFAADDGVVLEHGVDDVGFADGRADDRDRLAAAMSSSMRLVERLATATPGFLARISLAARASEYSSPM